MFSNINFPDNYELRKVVFAHLVTRKKLFGLAYHRSSLLPDKGFDLLRDCVVSGACLCHNEVQEDDTVDYNNND